MNIKIVGSYDKSNCTTTETSEPINFNKEYVAMSDTKSEYDIGCYYEFSDYEDYEDLFIGVLASVGRYKGGAYPFECKGDESYRYIRPLTARAGEIRKPKPLSGFINIYNGRCHPSPIHDTKGIADEYCNPEARLACIDLSQFNEGEGL